jgi:GWxTD domain-containing protein
MDRTMKTKFFYFILCTFLTATVLFSGQKIKEKDLAQKHQDWLKITRYIILPEEREVFLSLASDRERDLFIQTFWKQRDPTPGTPQNEYREEHMKRFLYANTQLNRGTPREGWMTDMGRIHILLGPPVSIDRYPSSTGVHPCQIWYYYGDKTKGLPTYFSILFYQRGGSGEYKLYNPASDGPAALLIQPEMYDATDYQGVYEKIKELAPGVALASISMIPGEFPYSFIPSPRNTIILSSIYESPKKDINPNYATHFLNFRGVVSTEYLTNYIESATDTALIVDPILNINFLHFSINPKEVSIDYFEPRDQYFCNFQLNVSVRKDEELVFQYSKDFPFYFAPAEIDNIRANGIAIQDSFPLIEGEYAFDILIQNSVGKEFSAFDGRISVPEPSNQPRIIGPILGYELQDYASHLFTPFKTVDKRLLIDPNDTFSAVEDITLFFNITETSRDLWEQGKIEVAINGLTAKNPTEKFDTLYLKDYRYNRVMGVTHMIPGQALSPDYYQLKVVLKDAQERVVDEQTAEFIVSPEAAVPHPVILAKSFPLSNSFLYLYSLAYQYDRIKNFPKAEEFYQKAYSLNPEYTSGVVEYAQFLNRVQKSNAALNLIESVKGDEGLRFEYHLIKGQALMGMEQYFQAIENLLEGNKIYNSNTQLLNSLGFCYYKTNQTKEAIDVLRASLRLNPEQQQVQELLAEIEKTPL